MSALVCIITHWIRLMLSHNIGYGAVLTSLSYYVVWALNLERIPSQW